LNDHQNRGNLQLNKLFLLNKKFTAFNILKFFKMGLFLRSKIGRDVHGIIGYFKLADWWMSEFSEIERDYIVKTYSPIGGRDSSLVKGHYLDHSQSVGQFLSLLASWFNNSNDRSIAVRILKKAEEMIGDSTEILDVHFFYQHKIEAYYKQRDTETDALAIAIDACKKQIELAPQAIKVFKSQSSDGFMPSHTGFKQLMIIEEKNKNYSVVIELAQEAKSQGWRGDWNKRIERCKKKMR
jgi:hypothetical protein